MTEEAHDASVQHGETPEKGSHSRVTLVTPSSERTAGQMGVPSPESPESLATPPSEKAAERPVSAPGPQTPGERAVREELDVALRERDTLLGEVHAARVALQEAACRAEEEARARARLERENRALRDRVKAGIAEGRAKKVFEARLGKMARVHAEHTAHLLNVQKGCFEDELESLEAEATAACVAFEQEICALKDKLEAAEREREKERSALLAKTANVMQAVKRKFAVMEDALRTTEKERDAAVDACGGYRAMVDTLSASDAHLEKERLNTISHAGVKERARKNALIAALHVEIDSLRKQLTAERERSVCLGERLCAEEDARRSDHERHREDLHTCRSQSKGNVDRLGRLFATVMQDFATAQSEVSTAGDNLRYS